MIKELPAFKGYHVDVRLRQFRRVNNGRIEFIDFKSNKGEKILDKYKKSLDPASEEFKELINYL